MGSDFLNTAEYIWHLEVEHRQIHVFYYEALDIILIPVDNFDQ